MASADFPNDCPPAVAFGASGTVYRIIKEREVRDADFLSSAELGVHQNAPACKRAGLSIYSSVEQAIHRRSLSPRLGIAVAEGKLEPSAGMVEITNNQSGHITWWPFAGVERHTLFSRVIQCP
jgi:hypothetical protein